MCFSIAFVETTTKSYVENYKSLLNNHVENYFNNLPTYYFVSAFEHPDLPIVTKDKIVMSQWGLIPSWVKNNLVAEEIRKKTLNAKSETIFEKPSFSDSIYKKRAILGVTGFFEWQTVENQKHPYFIHSKNNPWLSLGCIYSNWLNKETGELQCTFSIVTVAANDLLSEIHNTKKRMPLVLTKEMEHLWLNEKVDVENLKSLMQPVSSKELAAYKVSTFLNYSKNNRNIPEAIKPLF